MMIKKRSFLTGLAATACGALLTLAFAPFAFFPLAVLALAGLIFLTDQAHPAKAGWLGFWFGVGLFSTGVYWIFISISRYGDVPAPVAVLITAALIAVLSTFPAIACYLSNRYFVNNPAARNVYAFPAFWVVLEWTRCWFFTGFPWLMLGYSQTNSPLKGYAPLFSVYGVSLAVAFSSGLLVQAITHYRERKKASLPLLAIATLWVAGALLALIPWTNPTGKPIQVSLVQGDIPQSLKWSPEHIALSLQRYVDLSNPLFGKSKLIVWPEAAIPLGFNDAYDYMAQLNHHAKQTNTDVLVGIPIENNNHQPGYFNALLSVGLDNNVYFKRLLVPFGEYIPFKKWLSPVFDFMKVPMANMLPGRAQQSSLNVAGLNIDASICYEVAFPELIRTQDRNMNLLLTVTNDAWFGHSSAQAQHLQMAAMRAIELARPLLFVSNDGITALINQHGDITNALPTHTPAVLTVDVQPRVGLTPWMHNGTDPFFTLVLFMLFMAIRRSRAAQLKTSLTS
ncbi:MAG TPA: apolipoprotein N-acyltransferase [Gammaproteobacteria bacterium]|jgi:apolipoprotein N-acyltransferase|nr:apolipoprotein N-acyltransferase [Gammaproteobacteria bacterium]